jgi:hypothetical protein
MLQCDPPTAAAGGGERSQEGGTNATWGRAVCGVQAWERCVGTGVQTLAQYRFSYGNIGKHVNFQCQTRNFLQNERLTCKGGFGVGSASWSSTAVLVFSVLQFSFLSVILDRFLRPLYAECFQMVYHPLFCKRSVFWQWLKDWGLALNKVLKKSIAIYKWWIHHASLYVHFLLLSFSEKR